VKADLTRTTFRPFKHYGGVVAQQGRVQLDADFNEQHLIVLHYLRALARDVFGPHGGPAAPDLGFGIAPLSALDFQPAADFAIDPGYVIGDGHYYVDGILCEPETTWMPVTILANNQVQIGQIELDGRPLLKDQYVTLLGAGPLVPLVAYARIVSIDYPQQIPTLTLTDISKLQRTHKPQMMRRLTTYLTQRDFTPAPLGNGTFQVYLDVWERLITCIEDDSIREVALNGPDTSARRKIVWQVKTIEAANKVTCFQPYDLASQLQPLNRGLLRARARPTPASQDPCTIAPDSAYRGPENQLYRVEIHSGGILSTSTNKIAQPATFKWSRENASVSFAIVSGGGSNTLALESLGRDERYGLAEGDWVQVEDDASVLKGSVSPLLQVRSIDRSRRSVMLSDKAPAIDMAGHPLLRRWDQKAGDPSKGGLTLSQHDNAARISDPGAWVELENGVQIQFADPDANYRPGDYWLIPARVATGDVEWPTETVPVAAQTTTRVPLALPPHGVDHHYAPLAVITVDGTMVTRETDCRMVIAAPVPVTSPGAGPALSVDTPGPEAATPAARPRARKRRTASPEA